MGELSARNFGLVIAYLVPGFITVISVAGVVPGVGIWLATSSDGQPSVGGFLYVTVASVAAGMLVSSIRWLVIDAIHHRTGIIPPRFDFTQLQGNLAAFGLLVDFHYRYYQFNANTAVAIAFAYCVRLAGGCAWCGGIGWVDFGFVIIEVVLFATSRDTLRKYYARASDVLHGTERAERSDTMSNGCGKEHGPKKTATKPAEPTQAKGGGVKKGEPLPAQTKGEKARG